MGMLGKWSKDCRTLWKLWQDVTHHVIILHQWCTDLFLVTDKKFVFPSSNSFFTCYQQPHSYSGVWRISSPSDAVTFVCVQTEDMSDEDLTHCIKDEIMRTHHQLDELRQTWISNTVCVVFYSLGITLLFQSLRKSRTFPDCSFMFLHLDTTTSVMVSDGH